MSADSRRNQPIGGVVTVAVLDGEVLDRRATVEPIHVPPAFADVTGDDPAALVVRYGGVRVATFSFDPS